MLFVEKHDLVNRKLKEFINKQIGNREFYYHNYKPKERPCEHYLVYDVFFKDESYSNIELIELIKKIAPIEGSEFDIREQLKENSNYDYIYDPNIDTVWAKYMKERQIKYSELPEGEMMHSSEYDDEITGYFAPFESMGKFYSYKGPIYEEAFKNRRIPLPFQLFWGPSEYNPNFHINGMNFYNSIFSCRSALDVFEFSKLKKVNENWNKYLDPKKSKIYVWNTSQFNDFYFRENYTIIFGNL